MGRIRSAENFVRTIAGEEAPLNTPDQALSLMKIIDATYESAQTGTRLQFKMQRFLLLLFEPCLST